MTRDRADITNFSVVDFIDSNVWIIFWYVNILLLAFDVISSLLGVTFMMKGSYIPDHCRQSPGGGSLPPPKTMISDAMSYGSSGSVAQSHAAGKCMLV